MNPSLPGANGKVYPAVWDASGNLYIGADFTVVGNAVANRIAKWDGRERVNEIETSSPSVSVNEA